jgi:hypothetical protein
MAKPNPQLEAALAQFAAQPGTTPDQEAQLRAALTADADRLARLNQDAALGRVTGYALEAAGNATAIGRYDKPTGLVFLPVASFQACGNAPSDDLRSVIGLQSMSVDFAHQSYRDLANRSHVVSTDMLDNLQSTLNGSPVLAGQAKAAVRQGHLERFAILDPAMSAGATYDGRDTAKAMNLPAHVLQTGSAGSPQGRYDARDLTFVMGHELQHGVNHQAKAEATRAFLANIQQQAGVRSPVHDYTDELDAYIQAGREDEAKAEIAGWNALLSRERQLNPKAAGPDLMLATKNGRALDFVEQDKSASVIKAVAKPGITFNPDGTLSQTPANVAAMGRHYFDRPSPNYTQPGQRSVGIGEHRDLAGNPRPTADYTNYYGAWAWERILAAEDRAGVRHRGGAPRIAADMAGLGLKEDLIEMEGLDLGRNRARRPYYDSSTTPASLHHFDHTQDGSVHPTHDHQHVPVAPASARRGPDDAGHPDHAMLEQIRTGVRDIDARLGKPHDAMSERISRSLLAACKGHRQAPPAAGTATTAEVLVRVDHVVLGTTGNIFAVQGRLDDPAHKRVAVRVEDAIRTPVEQSDERLQSASRAAEQVQSEARSPVHDLDGAVRASHPISM